MPAVFAWVDFAEADRRRMSQVIDLFREQDTRDELGIGVIRDALADLLFPGTSTIQTRAKYFLFIPWIYRRHEKNGTSADDVARRVRRDEDFLIESLAKGGEYDGVIGIDKRAELQRTASNIYWAGLGSWRIRRFQGSQDQYHRTWAALLRRRSDILIDDDKEYVDGSAETWDPQLPACPSDLLKETRFDLTRPEAEYLQHRILGRGATLLGHLVSKTRVAESAAFAWTHPEVDSFPQPFRTQVEHARLFSEVMHGAAILYNLMLSEERRNAEWIATYRSRFAEWAALLHSRQQAFAQWKRSDFWDLVHSTGAHVSFRTSRFVNEWIDLALNTHVPDTLSELPQSRNLIQVREHELKRSRSRLGNPRALERWSGTAGAQPLNYRWHRVRGIVSDILKGLETDAQSS